MAVSGALLMVFVLAHMLGNLQMFLGPEAINAYATKLEHLAGGKGIWIARIGLLTLLIAHVGSALRVVAQTRASRPIPYAKKASIRATPAGRTMLLSGGTVLAFVIYHILHFTTGDIDPTQSYGLLDDAARKDVYTMVLKGFTHTPTVLAYGIAQVFLFFHLWHGARSLFQTLGLRSPSRASGIDKLSSLFAGLILLGNLSIPLAIFFGLLV